MRCCRDRKLPLFIPAFHIKRISVLYINSNARQIFFGVPVQKFIGRSISSIMDAIRKRSDARDMSCRCSRASGIRHLCRIHSSLYGSPEGLLTPTTMKPALSAIIAFVMLIWCSGCTTQNERSAPSSVVTIQFVHPERFTDFSLQRRDVQYTATVFTQRMTEALQPVMESRFPGGQLRLQFTDIDLAGRRFSMASPPTRSSMPPRFSFNFALRDRSGRTLASGSQRLVITERSSLSSNPNRSSRLTNESRTLARWLQFLSVTSS
jgi:Protein of unknown function (DUF3016)